MITLKKDVIVIGAGCAGMIAALEVQKGGGDVAIIDKGAIGLGTNSALSAGIFAGPTSHYTPEQYIRDTLQTGRGINCELRVRLTAKEAPRAFIFLRSLGLELIELSGCYAISNLQGDLIPGIALVKALTKEIKNSNGIENFSGLYVTELLKSGEKVHGVMGFAKTGEGIIVHAPAIVIATGGAGAVYLRNDNQKGIMGQGYYLAAKAGLELWDMEFIQFYPLVIAQSGLPSLLIYPPYPKETRLINARDENLLKKYDIDDIGKFISTKRDRFSAIIFQETLKGPVYMDYSRVPVSMWKKRPLSLLPDKKFDFRRMPFAISPAAHFFMGGVCTDDKGERPFYQAFLLVAKWYGGFTEQTG